MTTDRKTKATNGLLFLGDVYPHQVSSYKIHHDTSFVINLEAPLTENGTPIKGKINLKGTAEYLESLFSPLPTAVSLANNHILDYGNAGFERTLTCLNDMRIEYFGAGTIEDNYNNPLILESGGTRIGLLGYCYNHYYEQIQDIQGLDYGPSPLIYECIKNDINKIRSDVDIIALQLHWGRLYSNFPTKDDVLIARRLINDGADVIIGHHSHTIQPVEVYMGSTIAYNLGNYIFPDLDIPAYFDENGLPTKRKIQKQRIWNNASAGIYLDLDKKECSVKHYTYVHGNVKERRSYYHKYLKHKIPNELNSLDALINKNLKVKRVIRNILEFTENPRLPSKNFIKSLLSPQGGHH